MKIEIINTTHEHYPFMEHLLVTAFPPEERRDQKQQRSNADHNPLFRNALITEQGHPVGLLTYWDFSDFVYIEHFAIDEDLRNQGYGQKALSLLKEQIQCPIVLEAEEPTNEISRRRIGFYQRQGFLLQEIPYLQPPYRPGDKWFPLKLMTYGRINPTTDFTIIRDTIYREVYQVSN